MAMASPTLETLETARVPPSSASPVSATEFSLPLTFFDTLWFRFPPTKRIFFYQFTDSTSSQSFDYVILPKLKHSLSLTLVHYLPVAGNIVWPSRAPKPFILYTPGDGVSLTVAVSHADLDRLSGDGIREAVELHPFVPQLNIFDDVAATVALQITLFPHKGFSIGISAHHAVLDGRSTTMFMKAWAYMCRQGTSNEQNLSLIPELTPFFDRSSIKDPEGLDMLYVKEWSTNSDPSRRTSLKVIQKLERVLPKLVRATFVLTGEDIEKLRERVLSELEGANSLHLSSFVLGYAYLITCTFKATEGESEGDREIWFGLAADFRTRLDPALPVNYFGNCVDGLVFESKARNLMDQNGFALVAEKLSHMIRRLGKEDILERGKSKLPVISALKNDSIGSSIQLFSVAGSPKLNVYETDFGWGKPKKVEIVSTDRNKAFALAESRDGSGGLEIGMALEKGEMEIFTSLFTGGLRGILSRPTSCDVLN